MLIQWKDFGAQRKYFEMYVFKCLNQSDQNCLPEEEVKNHTFPGTFELYIKHPYIDFNDIQNPMKYYMTDIILDLDYRTTKYLRIAVRKNKYQLNDNLMQMYSKTGYFYSFHPDQVRTIPIEQSFSERKLIHVEFRIDPQIDQYSRTMFNFWDLTGQIGGAYEVIDVICMMIIGYYNHNAMMISIINDRKEIQNKEKQERMAKGHLSNDSENQQEDSSEGEENQEESKEESAKDGNLNFTKLMEAINKKRIMKTFMQHKKRPYSW